MGAPRRSKAPAADSIRRGNSPFVHPHDRFFDNLNSRISQRLFFLLQILPEDDERFCFHFDHNFAIVFVYYRLR